MAGVKLEKVRTYPKVTKPCSCCGKLQTFKVFHDYAGDKLFCLNIFDCSDRRIANEDYKHLQAFLTAQKLINKLRKRHDYQN